MKPKKIRGSTTFTTPPSREQVEALAHAIWIDQGRPVGQSVENWLEAERQLGVGASMGVDRGIGRDPQERH